MRQVVMPIHMEDEIKKSYLDYAMSVIVSRALPDVRDGLKPSQRRILVAMHDLGLEPGRPHRKCAKIAGDTSGNYHPHGEAVVYPTLVRMAQDFNMRYPLVDGQGNFGSVDGDPPAAMRYTEARLSPVAMEMLADIDKDTVDFVPNYDGTRQEPEVLPGRFPNLLCNGCSGIAVGMATNIPPHNLSEVVDALVALIEDPEIDIDGIMRYIKGPDFPTGGIIYGLKGIRDAYRTGRGHILVRARARVETVKGRPRIVITEIPYTVRKAELLERIASLVRERKVDGVTDLRDESDREGLRIVVELSKDAIPEVTLNQLYKHTSLQTTFGVLMLALVDGVPRILNLKELMEFYLAHRHEVLVRRTRYELEKVQKQAHLLEGFRKVLDELDRAIELIRSSGSPEEARRALMDELGLSEEQARAVLDMRLHRLTGMERDRVEKEYLESIKKISQLEGILASRDLRMRMIKEELRELKRKFGDPRRTMIVPQEAEELKVEDLIADEDMVVTISQKGYIKRIPLDTYRRQRRGGRGVVGVGLKDEDFVRSLFVASAHSYLGFLTDGGTVYWVKVYELPEGTRTSKGKPLSQLLSLREGESVADVVSVREFSEEGYLFTVTNSGMVKRTPLSEFRNPRRAGVSAAAVGREERLVGASITDGHGEVLLATRKGQAVRFSEEEVRPMGRQARGVVGIRLEEGDEVVSMVVLKGERFLISVSSKGFGKRTPLEEYRRTHRGSKGVVLMRLSERTGEVVAVKGVDDRDELMAITQRGLLIRIPVRDVRPMGRATQGVRLMDLGPDDKVVDVEHLPRDGDDVASERMTLEVS
ncbi:MAG: DNA gyrase subunit A [Candidatus Latescibacterota bacterium]|nr:MAG: DNA gyrase subunit A [Candidatus Latescibacterota bacterium]